MFRRARWGIVIIVLLGLAAGYFTRGVWLPHARSRLLVWLGAPMSAGEKSEHGEEDGHGGHDHGGHEHAGHNELNSIELSKQAQANIGLKLGKVELTKFERSIAIPGIVVERPGRSTVAVTAPLSGIVTEIYAIQGEAVRPGQKLFELQLTHEELVQGQSDFLRVAEELDVIEREIKRLEKNCGRRRHSRSAGARTAVRTAEQNGGSSSPAPSADPARPHGTSGAKHSENPHAVEEFDGHAAGRGRRRRQIEFAGAEAI